MVHICDMPRGMLTKAVTIWTGSFHNSQKFDLWLVPRQEWYFHFNIKFNSNMGKIRHIFVS